MERKKIALFGLTVLILLVLAFFPSIVCSAEYGHTYVFEQPTITTLSNSTQIAELEDTRQNDAAIGAPLLPVRTANIFIPADEKVTSISVTTGALKSIEGAYTIQHATTPYPTSYDGPIKPDEPDPDIYSTDADYPSVIHIDRGSQYLCGTQIVVMDLSPVVYNPAKGQLSYYEQIEVTIQTERQGRPVEMMPFRNLPADRKQILRTVDNKNDFLLLNPPPDGQNSSNISPAAARDYVVITTSSMITAFTNLTNHRQSAAGGSFTTHIEDIANILSTYSGVDDAEKMRNFIKDMYTNYGTKYVVLGGDCDGAHGTQTISTRGCYAAVGSYTDTYIPADLYFGCLDGTWNNDGDSRWGETNDGIGGGDIDWQSEVYVGRIPADTATEATEQINKIIAYETGTPPYKTLLVGENLDSTPTWGGDRLDWVHGYMNSMPNTKLYDKNGTWVKSTLLSYINSNTYNWLNHLGHGNPTWNMKLANADIASMTNTKYFFHYTQACYSGSIDGRWSSGGYGSECILEDMVNSNDYGAFAVIGNSRYGWYNSGSYVQGASNLAHKEFVEAIFTDGDKRLAESNQNSKPQLDLTQGVYRWIAFETNLLGCPATEMATSGGGGGNAGEVIQHWTPASNSNPWGIACTTDSIWVGEGWGADWTYEYQTDGTATGDSWPYTWSPTYGPADFAFNPNTGMVWTLDVGGDNALHEMNPATGYTGTTISGPWTVSQRGLAYDPDTNTWFVGGWNEDTIYHINSSGTLLDSKNVGLNIAGLAYNPNTQHLFVIENTASNNTIYVLDAANNYSQVSQFTISGSPFSAYAGAGLGIDSNKHLWAVEQQTNEVYEITSGEEACKRDFNGDAKADILWRNVISGEVYIWLMNGTSIGSQGSSGTVSDLNWQIEYVGDYTGDGKADILWRHQSTGEMSVWVMNGITRESGGTPGWVTTDWQVKDVGDFNGDGKSDFLWRNESSGEVYIWLMNGTSIGSQGSSGTVSDLNWQIEYVGDYTGDGKADILWRHQSTGEMSVWVMNGITRESGGTPGWVTTDWQVKDVGDFNGDGKSDFLWRNESSGQVYIWLMNGTSIGSQGSSGTVSDLNWKIQKVGDYTGDGKADILWRHNTTGELSVWVMDGITRSSGGTPGWVTTDWQIK